MGDEAATAPLGLRERKKQRTRAAILETAMELFTTRGFDAVPVAEIARRAEVSEATVFNYFRTKEDLVYARLEDFWSRMLQAVAEREPDETIVSAFERFVLTQRPTTDSLGQHQRLEAISRMIVASPALLARERESYDQNARALAEVIAGETPAGFEAHATAHMLLGVHKALVAYTREQVLAGVQGPELARRVTATARKGFALLRNGLSI